MNLQSVVCGVALVWALRVLTPAADTAVRVWEDSLELPTYAEGPPNPNPPFDLYSFTRFNYPYPTETGDPYENVRLSLARAIVAAQKRTR